MTSHYSTSNVPCGPACSVSRPECIHTFMSSTWSGFYSPAAPQSRHKAINPVSCLQESKNGWYVEACNELHACTMHPLPFHTNSFTSTKYRSFALTDSYPTCLVRPTSFTVNQNAIINCTRQKTTDSAPMQRKLRFTTKKTNLRRLINKNTLHLNRWGEMVCLPILDCHNERECWAKANSHRHS